MAAVSEPAPELCRISSRQGVRIRCLFSGVCTACCFVIVGVASWVCVCVCCVDNITCVSVAVIPIGGRVRLRRQSTRALLSVHLEQRTCVSVCRCRVICERCAATASSSTPSSTLLCVGHHTIHERPQPNQTGEHLFVCVHVCMRMCVCL